MEEFIINKGEYEMVPTAGDYLCQIHLSISL